MYSTYYSDDDSDDDDLDQGDDCRGLDVVCIIKKTRPN